MCKYILCLLYEDRVWYVCSCVFVYVHVCVSMVFGVNKSRSPLMCSMYYFVVGMCGMCVCVCV